MSVSISRATKVALVSLGRICDTEADMYRVGRNAEVGFARIGGADVSLSPTPRATFRMGIVCATHIYTGVLWASDGKLVTYDGGYLIVN